MISLAGICGNHSLKSLITDLCENQKLPQAVLFCGEAGTGRNLFARFTAAAYLEDTAGMVQRRIHPDCIEIRGGGASGEISVDSVREVSYEMNKSAVTADSKRAVIIEDAYNLNRNSSAALLKTLEQPPPGVVFILTATGAEDLSDTVRSRCAVFCLDAPGTDECADFLKSKRESGEHALIDEYSRLFRGRVGLVIKALDDDEFAACFERAKLFAEHFMENDPLSMLSVLDKAENRKALAETLRLSVFYLAGRDGMKDVLYAVKQIEDMARMLAYNLAPKLLATVLVSRIARSAA